ncbi:MAG: ABC transporter permease, partial [Acidimicrobiales bacterium]
MLLAMFSLVIFTLTFMVTFMNLFANQVPELRDEIAMGHELFVKSNSTNPITDDDLLSVTGVERVNGVARAVAEWESDWVPSGDTEVRATSGLQASLLSQGVFQLVERDPAYASDSEAFDALLNDPSKILVPEWFIGDSGAPSGGKSVGRTVTLIHPTTSERLSFKVIGTFEDYLRLGAVVNSQVTSDFLAGESVVRRHYVALNDGVNADEVASTIDSTYKDHGVDAQSFEAILSAEVNEQQSIMDLLQGYLSMGLLIGVAGLGVVLVRAVRERRREVGTLRAIGVTAQVTRRMFLVESGFIAIQGIIIGAALGLLSAYQTLTNSEAFGESRLDFAVPWIPLGIMLVIPLIAAILAALGPAVQASRIKPAVALRISD